MKAGQVFKNALEAHRMAPHDRGMVVPVRFPYRMLPGTVHAFVASVFCTRILASHLMIPGTRTAVQRNGITLTVALVAGYEDEDARLRNVYNTYEGTNVVEPQQPRSWMMPGDRAVYDEYSRQDLDAEAEQPNVVKRSGSQYSPCETVVEIVHLNENNDGYEYRPDRYVTESCRPSHNRNTPNMCAKAGFSCRQIKQDLYITRRKRSGYANNCWEQVDLRQINASCECMLPQEEIGIKHYYLHGK
uniref:Uncharacterized protein n=1 Tax=Anopheles culicifacies TaxID=139723 RepID=A0A182MKH6_9DIPT